jgi:hypothetical protein
MRLNTISTGTWNIISNYLNYNFNKLSVATNKLKSIDLINYKGVYTSETELKTLHGAPVPGDYAFVIVNSNSAFKVYYVNASSEWITDNGVYDPEVIMGDYIQMTALSNVEQDLRSDIEDYNGRIN